jgi:hypothetical protein
MLLAMPSLPRAAKLLIIATAAAVAYLWARHRAATSTGKLAATAALVVLWWAVQ